MFLFAVLAGILILLVLFSIGVISIVGSVGIVLLADVIVCIAIIVWLIRYLKNRK